MWLKPDGSEMSEADWNRGFAKSITVFLNGDQIEGTNEKGQRVTDDSFLVLFNAHYEELAFSVPAQAFRSPLGSCFRHRSWCFRTPSVKGHLEARRQIDPGRALVGSAQK